MNKYARKIFGKGKKGRKSKDGPSAEGGDGYDDSGFVIAGLPKEGSHDEEDDEPMETSSESTVQGLNSIFKWLSLKDTDECRKQNQKTASKKALPKYNILLLGGSGAGKSTTINSFANYEKYPTIKDAVKNKFVELISSSFKLAHPETDEEFCIESGHDANESDILGQSRTKDPMAYRFTFADKIIRLIDTPGMGDARGLKADKENFEKILEYLKNYETLHGIIIMMKSNETLNSTAFNYCITELFSRLHRSASENIFFCFTFSRNTFYRAGDGFYLLNQVLNEEFPDAKLELKSKVNCFFIDNEAYRYLVAKKAGYPFETDQMAEFAVAWNKSADQTRQMFSRIIEKSPHNLLHTFKLNMAQNFIAELAEPIVRLQKNIFSNMNTIERQKQSIERDSSTIDELKKTMHMTIFDMKMVVLEAPNTVCASNKCREIVLVNGVRKVDLKKCCIACPVEDIPTRKKGELLLKYCEIFNKNGNISNKCRECGCSWKEHLHVKHEYQPVQKKVIDPVVEKELKSLLDSKKSSDCISRKIIEALENTVRELNEEMEHIQRAAACFGYLLNKHSNSSCNQFIEPHLDMLIEEEKMKIKFIKGYSDETLMMLVSLKDKHGEHVKKIEKVIADGYLMELEDIDKLAHELCQLKHSGQQFQTLVNQFLKDNEKKVAHVERVGLDMSGNQ